MKRSTPWAPTLAGLAAILALCMLVAPAAAGAVGSVSTGSDVAEDSTTHRFVLDAADGGNLSSVDVRYRSGVDLADAAVAVGLDRDGDGRMDERLSTARTTTGDRGVAATLEAAPTVAPRDAVVVEIRGVHNPTAVGTHAATVGATVDDAHSTARVSYRVTPFRSDDTRFHDVSVPGSSFQRTYATDSTLADARVTGADWRAVTIRDSTLRTVRGTDDRWSDVTVADATATGLRTERTRFDGVDVTDSTVTDVGATGDTWEGVAVRESTVHDVDSRRSTYTDVRLAGARVDGLSAEDSTLDGVAVRPAADTADGNVSDGTVGMTNGTLAVGVSLDAPAPTDDPVDGAVADVRGGSAAPNRTVDNVSLEDATLRNVTLADSALVDVRVESATLRNVTLDNVTLRGVTLSGATYADGTLEDEVITSEAELRQELLVDDAAGRLNDGDVEVGATATPATTNATADDGGAVDSASDGLGG